jgi:DNA-binding Lrp family transcriptional regulator
MLDKIKAVIFKYHRLNNKRFPPLSWIASNTGYTLEDVKKSIEELITAGVIKRYQTNNYLRREYAEEYKAPPIDVQAMAKNIKRTIISFKVEHLIRAICFMSAIVSIYITSSLSYEWTKIMLSDHWRAIILSTALPVFATFSIEGAIVIFREKKISALILGCLILLMSAFSIIFDSSMIIIAQYNKRLSQITLTDNSQQRTKKENKLYELASKKESEQTITVTQLKKELEEEKINLNKYEDGSKLYYNQTWVIFNLSKKMDAAIKELKDDQQELKNQIQKEDTAIDANYREDAYTWLSTNILHTPVTNVEFLIFATLAIFLVIIAPMGMFIALGLWRK